MPGFLIPADLQRMIPVDADPREWADKNLLASPGALVADSVTGQMYRIPTLVPATKPDGSCANLTEDGRCSIHAISPFGCAFFDCGSGTLAAADLARKGLLAVQDSFEDAAHRTLYRTLWTRLLMSGHTQRPAEELRKEMGDTNS
jgi:hypothetical protein